MIHRGTGTSFGGMWAFPGGVIEEDDVPPGTEPDPLPAARRAAARETHEEVGLDVDADSLVFWSHWLPPSIAPKRFSTWFFLAPASALHADEHVGIDGDEVHAHRWLDTRPTPSRRRRVARCSSLRRRSSRCTISRRTACVADAIAAADPEHFVTRSLVGADGVRYCLWAGDAGVRVGRSLGRRDRATASRWSTGLALRPHRAAQRRERAGARDRGHRCGPGAADHPAARRQRHQRPGAVRDDRRRQGDRPVARRAVLRRSPAGRVPTAVRASARATT